MESYYMFLWECVSVFELQYISVNVSASVSLDSPHSQLFDRAPWNRVEWKDYYVAGVNTGLCSNRRLNQGGRASLWQDLQCQLWKCLRRRMLVEKWVSKSRRAKYGDCDGVSSFQLQEIHHDVTVQILKYGIRLMGWWQFNHFLRLVHKQLVSLVSKLGTLE